MLMSPSSPKFTTPQYRAIVSYLTRRRQKLGFTQLDVDRLGGFSDGQCGKWEIGERVATAPMLDMWCSALGLDLVPVPNPRWRPPRDANTKFGNVIDHANRR